MKELPKAYNPQEVEDKIYKKWEESGCFNPDNLDLPDDAKAYTIVLPPPNITDKLHLGHSAMLAIEDLLIRYHRMKGFRTLWVPGTDHAAIATQNAVEKKLLKEEGVTRHDLGREKFLERVWEFLRETQATILCQTRKMGASLDWSREAFTLDEPRVEAVQKMFIDMYSEGLIYRGERIVNWCPRCHSTLADDEVEYNAQKANLYTFKYSKDFPFAIATTRPETKLGDTAVAVNPKDARNKKYIGKIFEVNFCGIQLKLKVIADRNVDTEFGTGALGVTPAHSMVDWQMAEENGLEIIKVINEDGKIREGFGEFSGKTVLEAREIAVEKLRGAGLLEKEEEIENNLSVCYRCSTSVEPLPSKQWFVAVDKRIERLGNKSLKERAIEAARDKEIKFIPDRFEKRYLDWMENLHDWCISRQIWFGHRIPAWYKGEEIYIGADEPKGGEWIQDADSLDTWFSSGMWTFSTLGWPHTFKEGKKIGDLAKFHPTQVLETGYEILTLWVSRMIMMSIFALDEIPFSNVYLHGMVLDKNGKKMSKSKGNGIDPLDMINKFGTDAVRLSLLIGNTPGNDTRIFEEKIAGFRNFTNKLWNIARYILGKLKVKSLKFKVNEGDLSLADKWILGKLESVIKSVTDDIENYRFSQAGEMLREFTWNDFADWYLEVSKFEKAPRFPRPAELRDKGDCGGADSRKDEILIFILKNLLKLWHPFMPFVTEKIWEEMGNDKMLIVEEWPTQENNKTKKQQNKEMEDEFELIKNIITAIRNARAQYNIKPSEKIKVVIYAGDKKELVESQSELIKNLRTGIDELGIKEKGEKQKNAIFITVDGVEIYLIIHDLDFSAEIQRLEKEIGDQEKRIAGQKKKLENKDFIERAPEAVVNNEKKKLIDWEDALGKMREQLEHLR